MSCSVVQLPDGSWVRVRLARGRKLTARDVATLVQFAEELKAGVGPASRYDSPAKAGGRPAQGQKEE
jgi:hypothetical protein